MSSESINTIRAKIGHSLPIMLNESNSMVKELDNSKTGLNRAETGGEILGLLKLAKSTDDLGIMIDTETHFVLSQIDVAMERSELWPDEMNSIISCENQLAKGLKVFDQLKRDPKKYQAITDAHVEAGKKDYYPNDSFRKFLDAQHARLRNALKNPHGETDKQILEARDANVKAMRRLYRQMQIDLLPPPNRTLGALGNYLEIRESQAQEAQPDKQINQDKGED
ncbi:MAG: hypothetical protein ACRCTY_06145 [Candidatus Adiutrix sp.]